MAGQPVLIWFRRDLRLDDNLALQASLERGQPLLPVYIHSPQEEPLGAPGGAASWWLHGSLKALDASLRERGSRLLLRKGSALGELQRLAAETGARSVCWSRRYEPDVMARDTELKSALIKAGIEARSVRGNLLLEPWNIETRTGGPYRVFTPFWKALRERLANDALPGAPSRLSPPESWPRSLELDDVGLLPAIPWDGGLRAAWMPGEVSALRQATRFFEDGVQGYPAGRDRPDLDGTSRLSAHLAFGEISPRRLLQLAGGVWNTTAESWIRQLAWREFATHLLYHFPHTVHEPLREAYSAFPWRRDRAGLKAWQQGRTGYPIIDAGMRQLWTTGWMHNRVRMLVGSFLVKDLLLHWRHGAAWFMDTLVDADLANNTMGWQWIGGCGADAAPFFRIFNPVTQGERFDPDGAYVRRWVPELAGLGNKVLHKPWTASAGELRQAGVQPGSDYPHPLVDHGLARRMALEAHARMKQEEGAA